MLWHKPIVFKPNLADALELGEDIIERYQKYLDYLNNITYCHMYCNGEKYGMGTVFFSRSITIKIADSGYTFNPNQLLFEFGDEIKYSPEELKSLEKRDYATFQVGECDFCGATHIKCESEDIVAFYDDKYEFECSDDFIYLFEKNTLRVVGTS